MESTASPALHSKNTQIIYSSETSTRLPPHYHSHIVRPTPSRRPFSLYVVAYGKEISLGKYIPSFPPLLSSLSLSLSLSPAPCFLHSLVLRARSVEAEKRK